MDNNAALTWKWCQFSVWQITHTVLLKLPGGTIWNVLACSKASALLDSHPDTFHCYLSQWAWMVAPFSLAALLLTGWQMWLQHGVGKPLSSLTVYTWETFFFGCDLASADSSIIGEIMVQLHTNHTNKLTALLPAQRWVTKWNLRHVFLL